MSEPTCECGHRHATAEQDGTVSVFHRCRARGCGCREYRPGANTTDDATLAALLRAWFAKYKHLSMIDAVAKPEFETVLGHLANARAPNASLAAVRR